MNKFQKQRATKRVIDNQVETAKFLYQFYAKNMNWFHRKAVLILFKIGLHFLSGLVQSFASLSIDKISMIPPKIDIYSYGNWRNGLSFYLFKKNYVILAQILSEKVQPHLIPLTKTLIASNYREVPGSSTDSKPKSEN